MLPSLSLPPLECCLGTSPIQAEKLRPEFRVKLRRTQYEHVFSALPSNSDIARRGRHVSKVPNRKCLASQVWPLTQGFGPVGYSTEPLVSYQINRHGSAWSQCRDDCRRSIAAKIRKARREQPSRIASVRQDPIRPLSTRYQFSELSVTVSVFHQPWEAEERCLSSPIAGSNCAVAHPRSCISLVWDMRCVAMSGMRH